MTEVSLQGKVKDPKRHAVAVRASKWCIIGLLSVSYALGLVITRDPIAATEVMLFLCLTLSVIPILFMWYMLGAYSHPLTTVYALRIEADDLILRDSTGGERSLRGGHFGLTKTNGEIWKNVGTKHAHSTLSAVLQAQGPSGPFFIVPDVPIAPNADCVTSTLTTSYQVPQAAYLQIARFAADPPRV